MNLNLHFTFFKKQISLSACISRNDQWLGRVCLHSPSCSMASADCQERGSCSPAMFSMLENFLEKRLVNGKMRNMRNEFFRSRSDKVPGFSGTGTSLNKAFYYWCPSKNLGTMSGHRHLSEQAFDSSRCIDLLIEALEAPNPNLSLISW